MVTMNKDHEFRGRLVSDSECPKWLIKGTLDNDTFEECLMGAALNPNAEDEWIQAAADRILPYLKSDEFRKRRVDILLNWKNPETQSVMMVKFANDRDEIIKQHIKNYDKNQEILLKERRRNPKKEWMPTDKFRVVFIIPPAWGVFFPPYGIAKLTSLLRTNEYAVKVYDTNVESFHFLRNKLDINYWENNRYFVWEDIEAFEKIIRPDLDPLFDELIDNLVKDNPKVIGLSMYNTTKVAAIHIAKRIREVLPNVCLIVGGPEATYQGEWWLAKTAGDLFNYVFKGESEEEILSLFAKLESIYDDLPYNQPVGTVKSRLKLENYAYPDYSDYDLSVYEVNGISIETSRGCIAKCSFCGETQLWKYRDKNAIAIADEFEHQIKTYGTTRFWIVDSLINGNLKIFNDWMDLVIERELNIVWNCYSRCDGRMDAAFFKKIKESGCTLLSFGIESGSQKILDDMHKKVKIWEILQNMKDCHEAGIWIHSSWLQGFPTETALDHMHSRQLIFNCRKYINSVSLGMGAGITPNSDMHTNWKAYKLAFVKEPIGAPEDRFLGDWYAENYVSTPLHRFLRVKIMNIWCHALSQNIKDWIIDFQPYPDMDKFYKLEFKNLRNVDQLEQNYYLDCFHGTTDDFSGLLCSDYNSILYSLWEVFGALKFEFTCDPDLDMSNFGLMLVRKYWCTLSAEVDDDGNYEMSIHHKLIHADWNEGQPGYSKFTPLGEVDYDAERAREDMSFDTTVVLRGNFKDWIKDTVQVQESVHPQYRKKSWKIETIEQSGSSCGGDDESI
jgi:hypothetical protein